MKPKPPATCGECEHFQNDFGEWGHIMGATFCRLSGEVTYRYANPVDRPVPRPTRCPWNPVKEVKHFEARHPAFERNR